VHSTSILLPEDFYLTEDVVSVAKQLLGKVITTNINGITTSGIIVETEAYRGPDDKACHAYGGRCTDRTKTMFENGGSAYVYICYGMHPMMNVVTAPKGVPHAVLIRAIQPIDGIDTMCARRQFETLKPNLTNGPAKLAVALGISKSLDGAVLYNEDQAIKLYNQGLKVQEHEIISGPRVGMSHHVGSFAHWPWRFYIKNNAYVSKPLKVDYTGKW
jgi:DNA-3-methyladenine glycosylase